MATPRLSTHIAHITDTFDIPAQAKLESAYEKHTHDIERYRLTIIPAVNSLVVGTNVSELFTNSQRADRLILSVNYAPPDRIEGTKDNIRNDFFCADLGNKNATVCGTSNGLEFSYIKPRITELYRLTNTNHLHSQFRSLEVLPEHSVLFSDPDKRKDLIAEGYLQPIENIDEIVPDVPNITHVMQVDNFGNVKLFLSKADRRLLERLTEDTSRIYFSFKNAAFEAAASKTLFAAPIGTNVVALSSSSTLADGRSVPIIATIRDLPAETLSAYQKVMPAVGEIVTLSDKKPPLLHRLRGALFLG